MKAINHILSIGLASGLLAATSAFAGGVQVTNKPPATADATNAVPGDTVKAAPPADAPPATDAPPAPAEQTTSTTTTTTTTTTNTVTPADDQAASVTDTNAVVDPATGELKLRMKFHNAPLETVLDYMSAAAGYIIHPRVPISGKVSVWSDQPMNKDEALALVKQMLNENGYAAIMEGRTLTIYSSGTVKHMGIPVILGNIPTNIPINTEIVTQIIPVRSLNAVALKQDLQPLLPPDTTLTANESGNALVVTDTQANIHRIAEIVRALDSVSSSSATIIVFPLKFADAKSVASLIKDLFPTANASGGGGSGGGGFFGRFRGFGGGGGGGDTGGGAADTGAGHTPTSRVTAVSDDHANALVVSAPDDLVPTIKELVASIDTDVQDMTEVRVFALKNADPNEMATLLSGLFPDDSKTEDNNNNFSSRFRFGVFGAPPTPSSSSANTSDRVKRQNRVLAVPDARTGSLVVSASKDMMPQIATMVERLDNNPRRKIHVYVVQLKNAETQDVLPVLQDIFPTASTSKNSSTANSANNNALQTRGQSMQTQQNSQTSNPFGSSGGGGARPTGF